ncbi:MULTISPECIES: L,D-transpeptidase family protein [Alphaproteobacteria]|uniref:Peptidoglycan-binding protein n=2 Tax=Alphaproteobacteria TaxID=28211 RepID=A0A512HCE8_9HYPH|nr:MULTISPECIES: murein L,D-transpeptidase [Alphaproteobacteria]GEO83121.1 peptidoglycan-binding protein [Ciceribacter naphthalenivorans]GLR20483.1 peptidoglycan-binding protein [Ciceribacter naphthalenivorans]GLT03339.1 peptidoglycan-binding protein [Sphingomonas psychrolutea]
MKNYTKIAATTALAAITAFSALPRASEAATLLDLLRGGPGKTSQKSGMSTIIEPQARGGLEMGDPEPLPKVAGPRYYTYKAEATRAIVLKASAALAGPNTDNATPTVTTDLPQVRRFLGDAGVRAPDEVAKAVEAYYNDGKPLIWVNETGITERARQAVAGLAAADTVGLTPEDYVVALPVQAGEPSDPDRLARDLARFEVALSAKLLTYAIDTARGRIDPNGISGYHDFKRKTVNLKPVLNMLRLSPDVAAYLRSRDPDNSQFQAMKAELARLRAADSQAGAQIEIAPGTLLKPGQSNPELANILAVIKAVGSEDLKTEHGAVLATYAGTPDYAPELVAVVEAFQKEKGLKPDGVVGRATIRALTGHSNAEKIDKLVIAMEELRWLPDDLGARYVFINQPAYTAYYINEGREQVAMRVVVGSKSNQTYFFQDQIETVEFNPYWGVPKSIIINEMLPKLRRDPSYLDRLGYEVSHQGRKVSSTQIDWNTTHSVDVRQPPGGDNALGELKILFPNSHAIYMHDTPSKSFFKRDMRALSHGCVRLAEPRVMAAAVMGTTTSEIAKQIASGQNRAVQVPQKVPVYVSYFTAWPNKNGTIEYFDDVYGRDDATRKAITITSAARAPRS